ncbi:MAG: thiamine pyrophosphate-dependent enzyme [Brevinematales bacterium]|nr:thiamine pyrophosphate-dependent enzyme [Brevinematales bacterium]
MAINLKQIAGTELKFTKGHRMCAGCGVAVFVRELSIAAQNLDMDLVIANATGCLEVTTSVYPESSWKYPWIHTAFENAGSTISGIERAYYALKAKGKINHNKKVKFVAIAGDGGSYDIGLQSLSGALERGHNILYIAYDNEAYMNTGYQRSSATPLFANTTTAPFGKVIPGKTQPRKDLFAIAVAHNIPYAATVSIYYWNDLIAKIQKALTIEGPTFILSITPCIPGWVMPTGDAIELSKSAVETGYWPLVEYENGNYKWSPSNPRQLKPIEEFISKQKRFAGMLKNPELVEQFKQDVMVNYEKYRKLCGVS